MDQQEQGYRSVTRRVRSAARSQQRTRSRHPEAAPTREIGLATQDFKDACRIWASRLKIKPHALFQLAHDHGRTIHWMRERYYGGTNPRPEDIAWVHLKAVGENAIGLPVFNDLDRHRAAVSQFCRVCVSADDGEEPLCPDSLCPLRSVSPLPLASTALRNAPFSADDVSD